MTPTTSVHLHRTLPPRSRLCISVVRSDCVHAQVFELDLDELEADPNPGVFADRLINLINLGISRLEGMDSQ